MGLKLEPKEQVLTAIRRREHEEAQKTRQLEKIRRQKEREERSRLKKQHQLDEKAKAKQ